MSLSLAVLTLGAAFTSPQLVDFLLQERYEKALEEVESLRTADLAGTREAGLDYLYGHLLERIGDPQAAAEAFADAMTARRDLSAYSRYRLAKGQLEAGHPEVAGGLLATILANQPPAPLTPLVSQLLAESMANGADCRLLTKMEDWPIPSSIQRDLLITRIDCQAAAGANPAEVRQQLIRMLQESPDDGAALAAAERLAEQLDHELDPAAGLLLGLTFFKHREFERSEPYLARGLSELASGTTAGLPRTDREDLFYALARSRFWLGRYRVAAETFADLAALTTNSERIADARYQQGRCFELAGDSAAAVDSYQQAYSAQRVGRWAPAALLASLRLAWQSGRDEEVEQLFTQLGVRKDFRPLADRSAFFLAASDISAGHSDRAATWLDFVRRHQRGVDPELEFWQARLAELQGGLDQAVERYLAVIRTDPYHPLAVIARSRLEEDPLKPEVERQLEGSQSSTDPQDLLTLWLILGEDGGRGQAAGERLQSVLAADPGFRPHVVARLGPAAEWPLWQQPLDSPEEVLLSFGIVEHSSPGLRRRFPYSDPSLAIAASTLLLQSGLYPESLRTAETLTDGIPDRFPTVALPLTTRHLLYPRPYEPVVEREGARFGVDPDLLMAIMREESRFDRWAVSEASARGLTQFVLPTARRVAQKIGWQTVTPIDLHRAEVAITLGAAYLAELIQEFEGRVEVAVAAYNAGEPQAHLWQDYCVGDAAEEFYSKVGFRQTRAYLQRVLSSRAIYEDLYEKSQRRDPKD